MTDQQMTDQNALLSVVRDLHISIRSDDAEIEAPTGACTVPVDGLFELLSSFDSPSSVASALASLPSHGAADGARRAATAERLVEVGALAPARRSDPLRRGFGDPVQHARMLHDVDRTRAWLRAVRDTVREGDVVLDLGTGTGILAVAAAQAGARHVYAVETSSIADVAEEIFARNGVSDRVTLLRDHSTRVTLPELANVVVTETLGDDPLAEGIILSMEDARQRLLAPNARMVPGKLRLVAQLVEIPDGKVPFLSARQCDEWKTLFGMDLLPLATRHPRTGMMFSGDADVLSRLVRCSEPIAVDDIDLAQHVAPSLVRAFSVTATRPAKHVGLALGCTVDLAPGLTYELGPQGAPTHWRWPVFSRLEPQPVEAGQVVSASFSRDCMGCVLDLV